MTRTFLKAQEISLLQHTSDFGFAAHWLKIWRQIFKPITKFINRNRVMTFDSHLKSSLTSG